MPRIAFGLGSNIGDCAALLAAARQALAHLPGANPDSLRASQEYHNPALLPDNAPAEWNRPFINQVITLEASAALLSDPTALLGHIQAIEKRLGRIERGHWGPREIDIDIIAIEGRRHELPELTVPHPHAHQRLFVTEPLKEVWPDAPLAGDWS